MSGHSKFSNIKHKKEKSDAAKAKVFTRLGRELMVAVKSGGPLPAANGRLKEAIIKAKAGNMPNDTIDRIIKKAAGNLNDVNYEAVTYEGYGPGGVAVLVEALTDNRNRAAANVRNAFTKGGGNMGALGCVSYLFDEKGLISLSLEDNDIDEDDLMMQALEAGAEDVSFEDGEAYIITNPEEFAAVRDALEKSGLELLSAEVTKIPSTYTSLSNPEDIKKMNKLLDLLDEEDDVQNVYHSWEN